MGTCSRGLIKGLVGVIGCMGTSRVVIGPQGKGEGLGSDSLEFG